MVESGGVLHHGTYEEDGPVTWEALSLLGRYRSVRRAGYPSPKLARLQAHVPVAETFGRTSACPEVGRWRGEPEPRPKEARESEGRIGALTSGNLLATRTRPSKGGPC